MEKTYKVLILGSGPGGYVAAIRSAQLGLSVCLVEKDKLGGVCLNAGCIPTKALIKGAQAFDYVKEASKCCVKADNVNFDFSACLNRKEAVIGQLRKGVEFLLKKRGVDIICGEGRLLDANTVDIAGKRINFENCIVAVGSKPAQLSSIQFDKSIGVLSSDDILELKEIPSSLLIIGGGNIGCEFAYIYNRFGCEVSIVELTEQILPNEDPEIARILAADFKKNGIGIFNKAQVTSIQRKDNMQAEVMLDSGQKLSAEKILLSVGRIPYAENCGILEIGVNTHKGRILVDQRMRTNIENIYAIGDVVGKGFLAHTASREAIVAVQNIAGKDSLMNYDYMPRCIYTSPEIASVGLNEKAAKDKGLDFKTGKFPFLASGKAQIEKKTSGLVKIIAEAKSEKILGASICGASATELIHEICVAMEAGFTFKQLAKVIHAHPTLSESVMEAAEAVEGLSIHSI